MIADRTATDAVAALKALTEDGGLRTQDLPYVRVLEEPEAFLGPFGALPETLQAYLQNLYCEEEDIRTLSHGALSRGLVGAGAVLSRTLYAAERVVGELERRARGPLNAPLQTVRQRLRRTARESTHLPFVLRRWLHSARAQVRLRLGRRDLATLLRARGFDFRPLAYRYLQGLPQPYGCQSALKRAQPQRTYSQLVGFDFVQSGGKLWFLEANCNPVLMDARLALYRPGEDPWVSNFIGAAQVRGFNRVVVYGYRPFAIDHARALMDEGRRCGVEVEVIDDVFAVQRAGRQRAWLMRNGAEPSALVVRAKTFDVLFDRSVVSKQLTREIVEAAHIDWGAVGGGMPRLLTAGAEVPNYRADSRYPTLVAKVDELDRGAGVSFYKVPRVTGELAARADFIEEYRVPDPVRSKLVRGATTPLADGHERAWKIRSYGLLTPEGAEYLSSIKVICGRRIPEQLPDGLVAQKSIYLATINEGGFYSAVTAAEDEQYRNMVRSIGGALLGWLQQKYTADLTAE